jgi:hypothetical protein
MSRLEDDLLELINNLDRERRAREKKLAERLLQIYEECRKDLYIKFIDSLGGQDKLKIERLEEVLRDIEKQIKYYTNLTADARKAAVDSAFLAGQEFGKSALAAGGIELGVAAGAGTVNRGMVESLIGNIPRLASKVEDQILFRIRDELTRGAVLGESVPKIAKRILGTGLTQEGLQKPFKHVQARAMVIAQTEINKASDAGYEDLMVKAQALVGEEILDAWITAGDDRVDDDCRTIAYGTNPKFRSVPGYPGVYRRGSGPRPVISTHPRCRCRRIPFLKSWAESGALDLNSLRGRVDEGAGKGRAAGPPVDSAGKSRSGPGIITRDNSHIPEDKLTRYALNMEHPKGRDKAIVFQSALGYNQENYRELKDNILKNLNRFPAEYRYNTNYGDRYDVAMNLTGPNGKTARVLTGWRLKDGKARMVTIYVDKRD